MNNEHIQKTIYIVFGCIPATVLMMFSAGMVLSRESIYIIWGASSILGTIGLWLATFLKLEVEELKLKIAISILLVLGIAASLPIIIGAMPPPSFERLVVDASLYSPVLIALHYIYGVTKAFRFKET
jgi:hypothetical protein